MSSLPSLTSPPRSHNNGMVADYGDGGTRAGPGRRAGGVEGGRLWTGCVLRSAEAVQPSGSDRQGDVRRSDGPMVCHQMTLPLVQYMARPRPRYRAHYVCCTHTCRNLGRQLGA